MADERTPGLDQLQHALDAGDIDAARRALLTLPPRERELLAEEIGPAALERTRSAAARGRRRGKLGKVVVLPGIMGSELDSEDGGGDRDRIWLNYLRLIGGRIDDLELTPEGTPAKKGVRQVIPAGVHRKTYLPLLIELDTRWHVKPFPFDWREDIDRSADRLAGEIQAFGGGGPVHLVAHSMGGLVSRRFVQRHRDLWKSMDDGAGQGRGGRLVMLGTPNRGSFAIPLTLTGAEQVLRLLDKADFHHSLQQLLRIIGSFPGLYQMLPSPLADLGDDHVKLFDAKTWVDAQVRAPLLKRAQSFMRELDPVIDAHRLLYVAGYNQETPVAIRIGQGGAFSYRESPDGDGRVPHALGLLEGVTTYWVYEVHGNLAKTERVLDAITDLLQRGATSVLPTTKPSQPAPSRGVRRGWVSADELVPVEPEIDLILAGAARSRGGAPELTRAEEIRLEHLTLGDYLGTARGGSVEPAAEGGPPAVAREPRQLSVAVEVVWGDVTAIDEGDVYTVGHYQGVAPQRAELALDRLVSGIPADERHPDPRRLVITQHTRRGILRGALGDVSFFPVGGELRGKVVAVAGMGRPGTFNDASLRRLVSGMTVAVSALPHARTVCTVLIGSGEGTLTIPQAVRGLLEGINDAAIEIGASDELVFASPVERLLIVERERGRAVEILEALRDCSRHLERNDRPQPVRLEIVRRLRTGPGGDISAEESLALVVDSALRAARAPASSRERRAFETLGGEIQGTAGVRKLALERLQKTAAAAAEDSPTRRPRFRVESRSVPPGAENVPIRISFWDDGVAVRAAAIHQAATVPERVISVDRKLIDELAERMTDPPAGDVPRLSRLLRRLLVPAEFGEVLQTGPFVVEVDRAMARVHWEMLASDTPEAGSPKPLAVQSSFARQIRTTYSPPPMPAARTRDQLRALVIGDPGDPDDGFDLPGARSEALAVVRILRERGVDVTARIGAPSVPREGRLREIDPADRLEVLALLLEGGFDLLHYAGHGDFDPEDPTRVGWVFASGLLTPGEIGRIEQVPAIVVSNACLSARTSETLAGKRRPDEARSEAGLLPSLADEFFRLGVRNYVGTAWEVNDVGAELFATEFYEALLPEQGARGSSFGEAVKRARAALWESEADYGALWAAYQHYGDPTSETPLGPGPLDRDGEDGT